MSRRARLAAALALPAATALLAAGCLGGGDDGADAPEPPPATAVASAAVPIAVQPVSPGDPVRAGASTPAPVARALAGPDVVVIAFLVDGPADDRSVAAALRTVRASGDSARGVRYFVYRVGTDRGFGDLADALGVQGTPAVAVIARDRTLQNLWTGLVDAAILGQSISDAKATPAANPAAGARPAPAAQPAAAALARRVNAAYRSVPGVEMSGTMPVEGPGAMELSVTVALTRGKPTAVSGTGALQGLRFQFVGHRGGGFMRPVGGACWVPTPGVPVDDEALGSRMIEGRPVAVRGRGRLRELDVARAGTRTTYVVDVRSHTVTEMRVDGEAVPVRTLAAPPETHEPTPVCDDPSEALEGLPESLRPGRASGA